MYPSNTHDLFPTRLWVFDLSSLSAHFDSWRHYLHEWRKNFPEPGGNSNRKGWISEKILFDKPEFNELKKATEYAFDTVFRQMLSGKTVAYQLEGWANIHDQGGYNIFHNHANALLSGCFYLSTPQGSSPFVMKDPRPGVLLSPFQGPGINCNQLLHLAPKEGILIIFPHWLEHAVESHESALPRESIAMNALNVTLPKEETEKSTH